jgi:acyl dehydratase
MSDETTDAAKQLASVRGLAVGEELPTFVRATGFANWNRFAAVNNEFVPIHMDDEAGGEAGFPSAIGMGNLQWAFLHNVMRDWAGDEGRIERLGCQFRSPNVKGQTITAHGRIVAISRNGNRVVVDLAVWTENQDGERLAPGTATLSVPAENAGR